jgi:hypothetical protein
MIKMFFEPEISRLQLDDIYNKFEKESARLLNELKKDDLETSVERKLQQELSIVTIILAKIIKLRNIRKDKK